MATAATTSTTTVTSWPVEMDRWPPPSPPTPALSAGAGSANSARLLLAWQRSCAGAPSSARPDRLLLLPSSPPTPGALGAHLPQLSRILLPSDALLPSPPLTPATDPTSGSAASSPTTTSTSAPDCLSPSPLLFPASSHEPHCHPPLVRSHSTPLSSTLAGRSGPCSETSGCRASVQIQRPSERYAALDYSSWPAAAMPLYHEGLPAPSGRTPPCAASHHVAVDMGRDSGQEAHDRRESSGGADLVGRCGDVEAKSRPPRSSPAWTDDRCLRSLVCLVLVCLASFGACVLSLLTLPQLTLPSSIPAIRSEIETLRAFSDLSAVHSLHLKAVIGLLFIFKQTFSIPGSVLINILMGAIYDVRLATFLSCLFTAVGSTCAYYCSRLSKPLMVRLMPKMIELLERKLERFQVFDDKNSPFGDEKRLHGGPPAERPKKYDGVELWSFLLLARLIPVIPYSGLNLASGVLGIPIGAFFWSLMLGSLPYNLITCQVGGILREGIEIEKFEDIWTCEVIVKLVAISLVGLVPILFKNKLRFLVVRLIEKTSRLL